jgi:hypothetical protein
LKDINTQVLETKYVINLGQLLKIVPNIKINIFKSVKFIQPEQFQLVQPEPTCATMAIDHHMALIKFRLVRTLLMTC